jgi:acetolactate synthase regulatory subunit
MYQAIQLEAQMVHLELTVITDRSIDSPEELLMAVDGMHEQFKAASEIRELLSAYAN